MPLNDKGSEPFHAVSILKLFQAHQMVDSRQPGNHANTSL